MKAKNGYRLRRVGRMGRTHRIFSQKSEDMNITSCKDGYFISLQVAKPVQNAVRGRTKITQDEPPVNSVQLGSTNQTQGSLVV